MPKRRSKAARAAARAASARDKASTPKKASTPLVGGKALSPSTPTVLSLSALLDFTSSPPSAPSPSSTSHEPATPTSHWSGYTRILGPRQFERHTVPRRIGPDQHGHSLSSSARARFTFASLSRATYNPSSHFRWISPTTILAGTPSHD